MRCMRNKNTSDDAPTLRMKLGPKTITRNDARRSMHEELAKAGLTGILLVHIQQAHDVMTTEESMS